MLKGIDVAVYQGDINWNEVKNNVDFAILKSSYGREINQVADKFEENYAGAKSVGVPIGAYHYSYATTVDEAIQEAKACLEIIKGKTFEMPIWYDVEENRTFATGKDNVSAIINAFCSTMEANGYFCGLYMSKSQLLTYVNKDIRNRYALWIAQYYNECTYPEQYGMWQYSSEGTVGGINARVDMNYCYVDYIKTIKEKGLNGIVADSVPQDVVEPPLEAVIETPPVVEVTNPTPSAPVAETPKLSCVKEGDKNNKVRALQELLNGFGYGLNVDGDFGKLTENAVRDFQSKNGLEVDGIVGKNTWTNLLK